MNGWRIAVGLVALAVLARCSWKMPELPKLPDLPKFSLTGEGVEQSPEVACDAARRLNLQALDWDDATERDLQIRHARFIPTTLILRANGPNVLRIANGDDTVRVFRAREFFRSAAVVRIVYQDRPIAETCIDAIKIGPGKWAEIRIVPLRQGEFPFGEDEPPGLFRGSLDIPSGFGRIIVR